MNLITLKNSSTPTVNTATYTKKRRIAKDPKNAPFNSFAEKSISSIKNIKIHSKNYYKV